MQRDRDRLLRRLGLARRAAAPDLAGLFVLVHQLADVAADRALRLSFLQGHDALIYVLQLLHRFHPRVQP